MAKKTYVLDTSVYLTDAKSIYGYKNNDIIVPLKVLEEIDGHKKRQDSVGANARHFIRILDDVSRLFWLIQSAHTEKTHTINILALTSF